METLSYYSPVDCSSWVVKCLLIRRVCEYKKGSEGPGRPSRSFQHPSSMDEWSLGWWWSGENGFCGNETIKKVHNVIFLPEDFNLEIGSKASQEHPDLFFFFTFIILPKKEFKLYFICAHIKLDWPFDHVWKWQGCLRLWVACSLFIYNIHL